MSEELYYFNFVVTCSIKGEAILMFNFRGFSPRIKNHVFKIDIYTLLQETLYFLFYVKQFNKTKVCFEIPKWKLDGYINI